MRMGKYHLLQDVVIEVQTKKKKTKKRRRKKKNCQFV
jgi:hypothetical protein